jgi:hypothetical protein
MTAPDTNSFAKCSALLYAADEHGRLDMENMLRELGFGHVLDINQLNAVPPRTLPFYFLHGDLASHVKLRLLKGLRSSEELRRRYAPIICVLPRGPRHQMISQVEMGFDEVVFLSDPQGDTVRALAAQLGQDLLYIEAPNYFGPDRRRLERVSRGDPRRHQGGMMHHRIQVVRDPDKGIRATYLR